MAAAFLISGMQGGISPKKSLGQNFLKDPNTIRKIVSALQALPDDHVVEIGPGIGALTDVLVEQYATFTAIELDQRAVAFLLEKHPDLDVRREDVLDVDWAALVKGKGGPLHVIGNLPYYITSQILFTLLDARPHIREAVVMMQLEVAERLVAQPRTKEYGILSVAVQLHTRPELLFRVSPNVFYPKPDVTSAVIRLTFTKENGDEVVDSAFLRLVVREAFSQRRKTLRNTLSRWTKDRGIDLPNGWDRSRAEELSPQDFVALAAYLGQHEREGLS
jgi:16S rRNA (adenine1518-N6/adenine1519-N6)-dimethyltransferase